ncbi:MAG: DoxX family membrane protein [Propionibacteriaceae bacterium]|jgi:uncharacterized membrane protein YphA (DoxX/SURF4 family)|nr:DoxX family membrane protein [Propionibacteriaceae bacterium]
MKSSPELTKWQNWVSLAARLILGIVLIAAGLTKVGNLESSVQATLAYKILDYDLARVVGMSLPFLEIALGLVLVIGLFTRIAGAFGALMMLAFVIAISSVWARGISIDCGCFGDGGPIDKAEAIAKYPWEILRDLGLMACGLWLVFAKRQIFAIDTWLFRSAEELLAEKDRKKRRR